MALLVVVDVGVAVDEPGQQLVRAEVAGDELERGQPEGRLDHQVVGGDEVDLRTGVRWTRREALVGVDERLIEDDRKRWSELFA